MQSQAILKKSQHPATQPLPRLLIDEEFKIWLIKKGKKWEEVKMTSLCKIIYCLFLQYPQGISLYNLGNHQRELMKMYQLLCWEYKNKNQFMQDRITNLTCRCSNSVYEKISRIKSVMRSHLPSNIAHLYFIEGDRAEAKKIALPRNLVIINCRF